MSNTMDFEQQDKEYIANTYGRFNVCFEKGKGSLLWDVDGKEYIDGKPDYADVFEDNQIFCWDTQIGRGIDSSYTQDVMKAYRKHLMVKKSDAETTFYYMGQFDIVEVKPAKKLDNKGKERDIAKFRVKMRHAVRDDLLQYLESNID